MSPVDTTGVWLANGWANKAHSGSGPCTDEKWSTPCGLTIQQVQHPKENVNEYGSIVSWGLLNHDRVTLCRKCFR